MSRTGGRSFAKQACGQQSGRGTASEVVILISSATDFCLQRRQVTELDRLICFVSSGQIEDTGTREDEEEKLPRRFDPMVETSSLEREKK
jgi:hypothetical protein